MNFYLNKFGFQSPSISLQPNSELEICVVIPCFNETALIDSLTSLLKCDPIKTAVEVIVVINSGVKHSNEIREQNRLTYDEAVAWIEQNNRTNFQFHILLEESLPKKHAGVGLARKIGMDEAVNRFDILDRDGIIVCFDADSLCDENYMTEIEKHFNKFPKSPGCSIHYEHPVGGEEYEDAIYKGIINYELHLRYYNQGLVYAGLPFAYHKVGSSMAVRSSAYQKQGGMNKRKAGEDFYFIHKIIALGGFTELKSTRVIPSPRISDRVPFGTGKAIGDWIESENLVFNTYGFESFQILKAFVDCVPAFMNESIEKLPINLNESQKQLLFGFLSTQKFEEALVEIIKNSKRESAFIKRFFRWFDAFKVLKFMHYLRDNGISNQPVLSESIKLLHKIGCAQQLENELDQLLFIRELEKK